MNTTKKKARLSKAVRSATEPLVKASDVEEDICCTSPPTFILTQRSNMTTMEAKAAPSSLDALNCHLPGDTRSPPAIPALIQILMEEVVTDNRGKAPLLFTTEAAGTISPSLNDCCKSTLKELLARFNEHTAWKNFKSDWEHEVLLHLQNNSHFQEVKKHLLLSDEQLGLQQQPKPNANVTCMDPMIAPVIAGELELALEKTLQLDIKDPAQPPTITRPWFSITHPKGLRTKRNVCHRKTEAVLTESAAELEKTNIQQTAVHKQKPWWLVRPLSTQQATSMPLSKSSMKQKPSSEQPNKLPVSIRGSLQKQQAQALAKQCETMTRVPCSKKDVSKKRNCPLNAHKVCKLSEHQFPKDVDKRASYSADEAQMVATLNSKGYTRLPASEMHSMRPPGMLAQQLPQSNRISSTNAMNNVESKVGDILDEPAHSHPNGHSQGNVDPRDSHFPEKLELQVVTTASNRQFLIATMTPPSVVAVTTKSDGLPKATPVIRPRTIPPLSPQHGTPGKAQKTRSLRSL